MSRNKILKRIGTSIKKARIQKEWTQKQLADRMGLGKSTIEKYEYGEVDIPISKIIKLGSILEKNILEKDCPIKRNCPFL